jgi:hypothetical protein
MFSRIFQFLGFQSVPPSQTRRATTGGSDRREIVTVTHEWVLGSPPPPQPPESFRSAQLLKDAVQMKKEKRFDDACAALREALSIGGESVTLAHRLRLPSYLLLAGRNDEAWRCQNEMNIEFTTPEAQGAIAAKMAAVLKKEGRFRDALVHECWSYAMEVYIHRRFVDGCIQAADREASSAKHDEFAWLDAGRKPDGETPAGNPIHDCSFPSFNAGLKTRLSKDAIAAALGPLIRKFADERWVAGFSRKFAELLKGSGKPDFMEIRELVASIGE